MTSNLKEPPTRAQLVGMLASLRGALSSLIRDLEIGTHISAPGEVDDDIENYKELLDLTANFPTTPEDLRKHVDGGETFDMTWRFGEESHYAKKELDDG